MLHLIDVRHTHLQLLVLVVFKFYYVHTIARLFKKSTSLYLASQNMSLIPACDRIVAKIKYALE